MTMNTGEPLRDQHDSYAPRARQPGIGTTWIWEPTKPHARERIEVSHVEWNGEEWWVKTISLDRQDARYWNDLSRFWEACVPDPDPNTIEVGGELRWHGRPSFDKDMPSGWTNTHAWKMDWSQIGVDLWKRLK